MIDVDDRIKRILPLMDDLINDDSVPRNVRKAVADARERLNDPNEKDAVMKAGAAIYCLDEVSNDINMPAHARTQVWNILSMLETIK